MEQHRFVPVSQGNQAPEQTYQPEVPENLIAPTEQVAQEEAENTTGAPGPTREGAVQDFGSLPPLAYGQLPHNVTVRRSTTSAIKSPVPESILMPSAPSSSTEELLKRMPNFGKAANASDVSWAHTYINSTLSTPAAGALEKSLSREGSDWRQGVEINGDILQSTVPRFNVPQNAKLEGQQALQMALSHMQLGDIFHAGMWHSGFWVTFKPAPEPVWLMINRLLGTEVMGIARETYGLLHSSATALTVTTIINALLPYVYATSINPSEMEVSAIPNYLSNLDEHDFIWGFIAANYPRGFNIERSCIVDPSKCRHVIPETINVTEMQLVDNQAMPEFARQHMRSRTAGSMTLKSVTEYQARMCAAADHVLDMKGASGSETQVVFSVPSSTKKSRMSDAYISDIHEDILRSVTNETPPSQREGMYDELSKATEMRFYQHWVKEIRFGTSSVNKEEDVAAVLSAWTRDSELRKQFFEGISNFIDKSSYTVIGLEAAKCPACGADHSRPEQALRGRVDFIPVDLIQLFSNLAEFKTRLVSAR